MVEGVGKYQHIECFVFHQQVGKYQHVRKYQVGFVFQIQWWGVFGYFESFEWWVVYYQKGDKVAHLETLGSSYN